MSNLLKQLKWPHAYGPSGALGHPLTQIKHSHLIFDNIVVVNQFIYIYELNIMLTKETTFKLTPCMKILCVKEAPTWLPPLVNESHDNFYLYLLDGFYNFYKSKYNKISFMSQINQTQMI